MKKLIEFFASQVGRIVGIVALVLIGLFILNRFVPFVSTSYSLGTSALSIKEVKDIGELMSAEFYGEIIHSLNEGFDGTSDKAFETAYDSLRKTVQFLYKVHENEVGNGDREKIWKHAYKYFKDYSADREKLVYLHLLRIANRDGRLRKPKKDAELRFFKQLNTDGQDWDTFIANRGDLLRAEKQKYASEILNKIEIHYLCRGWVKAGYDLTAISNESLKPDAADSVLRITGLDPYILAADINPWFIPPQGPYTNGVPGFELLKVTINGNDRNPTITATNSRAKNEVPFRLISRTKKTARIELLEEALERDIFGTAKSSAEESLLQLIQMLEEFICIKKFLIILKMI